jgi:hypothetical protein
MIDIYTPVFATCPLQNDVLRGNWDFRPIIGIVVRPKLIRRR